jgi:hypothetical protein
MLSATLKLEILHDHTCFKNKKYICIAIMPNLENAHENRKKNKNDQEKMK